MEPARKKVRRPSHSPQRLCQHEHNGHLGRMRLMRMLVNKLIESETTIQAVKDQGKKVLQLLPQIDEGLKFRVNADGNTVEVGKGNYGQPKEPSLKLDSQDTLPRR